MSNASADKNGTIGEEIVEDLEDREDDDYAGDEFEVVEEASIQKLRREEMTKNIFKKDEERISAYLQQKRMSELEKELMNKDKQI